VLEEVGLIHVVRTKKIRAIEAKYYGRIARTYLLTPNIDVDIDVAPDYFLTTASSEFSKAAQTYTKAAETAMLSTLRYARIPSDRAGYEESTEPAEI